MMYRELYGGVVETALSNSIISSDTTFIVDDGSTFPSGTNPFVVVIDRGLDDEEKVLIQSRSTNTFTVAQRGYDGTSAVNHSAGAAVDHVVDATMLQDMNTTTYDNKLLNWMDL